MDKPCICCGENRPILSTLNANERPPIHFECWDEHHSDPTGVRPPGHVCWADYDPPEDERGPS